MLAAWLAARRPSRLDIAWKWGQAIPLLALLTASLSGAVVWIFGAASISATAWLPSVRLDALSIVMLMLTSFLGWVIVRYSRNYLAGEKGQGRYLAWLSLTLASVWLLVTLNNLLLVCLCWTATSFALHRLLTFYKDRPAALLAARKKFLISRIADFMAFTAVLLVYLNLGTLQIDRINESISNSYDANMGTHIAVLLLVLSTILRCAQLPFHGWLLQVMESPTPVSALLHAGIVNIGGFVLLRLAALLETTSAAPLLLVVAGSVTATLAALVMMTRISVKVMLAWSTCAQMGFMLLEIGLGAYSLALLHLVAHSLYKGYAFLSAGQTVSRQRMLNIAPANQSLTPGLYLVALAGPLLALVLADMFTGLNLLDEPVMWIMGMALASSLLTLVCAPTGSHPAPQIVLLTLCAFCLALLYSLWHFVFTHLFPSSLVPPTNVSLGLAGTCLLGLLVVQHIVLLNPQGVVSRWLHPRAFAGFHLDDGVSYIMLHLWPAQLVPEEKTSSTMTQPNFVNKEPV